MCIGMCVGVGMGMGVGLIGRLVVGLIGNRYTV
jgi:hypothetical protein